MKRKTILVTAAVILGGVVFALTLLLLRPDAGRKGARPRQISSLRTEPVTVDLYFADRENAYLTVERRRMERPSDPSVFARRIVDALIQGPESRLSRTLPEQGGVRTVFVTGDGLAIVDLDESVRSNHPGGSQTELLTIYSIVNSLALNLAEVEAVKILIDGNETDTLAGHVSLQTPLPSNMMMVR